MELESSDRLSRKQVFLVICGASLLVLVGFSIVNYVGNDLSAMWTNIVMASIVAGSALALPLGVADKTVYRAFLCGTGVGLSYLVAIGASLLYYQLMLPFLFFFFLGRREGAAVTAVFLFVLTLLMLAPWLGDTVVYQTGDSIRFLVAYLFRFLTRMYARERG